MKKIIKKMTNLVKYCIIIVLVIILFTIKNYAEEPGDSASVNLWKLTDDYIGGTTNFWCKWIEIHFGKGVDAKIKDGEAAGTDIININKEQGKSDDVKAFGYGLYQFDLKKHMVGYLYYLSEKMNDNGETGISKTPEEYFAETGKSTEPPKLNFKEACKYVADKLMTTAYSKDTVDNYLNKLLQYIESHNDLNYIENIKKCQSDYWYKVYGQKAYTLLKDTLKCPKATGDDLKKVQGALLSIMEDRYRNKNLKNKPKMQLSVDVGDLWPFLVYTETNDNGNTTLWQVTNNEGKIEKTDWKKMLLGAYQYMVYYEYKVDDDADTVKDTRNIYNGIKSEMFIEEYEELFDEDFPELKGKELDDFYQKIRRIRRYYKKSKENGGGVFGEEELYDISSDITYSNAIKNLSNKINGEFRDVFVGLDSEYIARTYLMAKNIADNTRLIEQNAQYDIGSNIISRTPGGVDNQILLSDLQLITLERDQNTGKYTKDTDGDGIIDGLELGNDDGATMSLKISGFIKKMLKAEAGDKYSSLVDPDYMYNMYKANIEASYNAVINAENNGSVVTEGREQERQLYAKHDLKVIGNDIYVDVYSYKSNPIMKDTDFDGVLDGYGKDDEENKNKYRDENPKDNTIGGKITMLNKKELEVLTHMDYRYFFMDKYNYYDELSVMSLIMSNAVRDRDTTNLSNIETINEKIGLNLEYREVEEDNIKPRKYTYKTKYAIGNKAIEYSKDNTATNMIKKRVIPIIIPSMTSESDGRSYSEIGEKNWLENNKDYGEEIHNVMSYEIYAEMIKSDIDSYENENKLPTDKSTDEKKVYWIMGYKEGGAIANILAAKLIDRAKDVYAYTFASPMTLYNNSEHSGYSRNGYLARYDSIFNVVNESDAYSFIMPQSLGFSRYGMTCIGNMNIYNPTLNKFETNSESVSRIIKELENIYKGNEGKTRTKTYSKDTNKNKNQNYAGLYNVYQRLINAINIDRNDLEDTATGNKDKENKVDTISEFYNRYRNVPALSSFINAIETNYEKIKRAGNEENYYYIAKNMNNADIVNVVNLHDKRKKRARKATASDLDGIHDGTFPCYQILHDKKINNEVPIYFQSKEYWSLLRYGTNYAEHEDKNGNKIYDTKLNDKTEEDKLRNDYKYGTFYASSCGAHSIAMVLSYILDKTITPVDVRNVFEMNKETYRDPSSTNWSSVAKVTNYFEVINLAKEENKFKRDSNDSFRIESHDDEKQVIKYLLQGRPIVALCHGTKDDRFGYHSSYYTKNGHYVVIAGIDTDDLDSLGIDYKNYKDKKAEIDELIDRKSNSEIESINLYVSDPAYYNQKPNGSKKTCTTKREIKEFYNDQVKKTVKGEETWTGTVGGAGVDMMWLFGIDRDIGKTEKNGDFENKVVNGKTYKQFNYKDEKYSEKFRNEKYTNFDGSSDDPIESKYKEYKLYNNENTWRAESCEKKK